MWIIVQKNTITSATYITCSIMPEWLFLYKLIFFFCFRQKIIIMKTLISSVWFYISVPYGCMTFFRGKIRIKVIHELRSRAREVVGYGRPLADSITHQIYQNMTKLRNVSGKSIGVSNWALPFPHFTWFPPCGLNKGIGPIDGMHYTAKRPPNENDKHCTTILTKVWT